MEGKDTVGGIVGKNKGEVRECSASGEIHGELSVGGIAGENNGFLAECRNEADVNTEYEEKKQELSDIDTDAAAILEKYRISKENTERSNLTYTDIGGVVGFSDGWCRAATTMARLAIRMSVIISAVWRQTVRLSSGLRQQRSGAREKGYRRDCRAGGAVSLAEYLGGQIGRGTR